MLERLGSIAWLLAQDGGAAAPKAGDQASPLGALLLPFIAIAVLFYIMMWRPEKKKQAEHQSLLTGLKKNDRVVTIGGIYGVVANVQREADRVTLKVDETNNTKIDVTFGAIARVIAPGEPEPEKK